MRNPTVAQQLIDVLRQAGVERVYGVVGDSLNPVVDAIRRTDGIEWVHVRNEEAAAFAAAAEAQLTGRLAVCAGSCGPGNTHLIQGLYDANRSGAPVLAIASHIPSKQIGTGFFQETHPERLFTECSQYCEMVSQPSQMPRMVRMAVQRALSDKGVSVLVMPGDLSHAPATNPTGTSSFVTTHGRVVPPAEQVRDLAAKLNAAEKVMLFCGAGVRDAHAEVMELAGRVHAPVGHTLRGKEWIQYDNPYDVGMSGLLGYGACYDAMHEADLVVLLGTDFPYDDFLPQAHTVQIDHDAGRIGRRTALELGVHGDVGRRCGRRCRWSRRRTTARTWTEPCASMPSPWRTWSPPTPVTSSTRCRSTPSIRRRSSTNSPTTTRCSPSTPACATSGPPVTSRPTAAAA